MNKGIVMEIKADKVVVMSADGAFHVIPHSNRGCQVGQEIVFADETVRRRFSKSLLWSSGVVAAAVCFLVVFIGMGGPFGNGRSEVIAYVSMDVNPSIEFGINASAKVVEQRGLNADGEKLIEQLDSSGQPLADVTDQVLKKLDSSVFANRAEGDVLLAIAKVKKDSTLDAQQLVSKLEQQVEAHLRTTFPQKAFQVTAITAPKEARDSANEKDLSMGKLAIYLKAIENGQTVTLNEFQTKPVNEIAKTYGGIGKLIGNGTMKQEDILQLVKADRNGTLGNNQGNGLGISQGAKGGSPAKSPSPTTSSKSTPAASPKSTVTPKASSTPIPTPTLKSSEKPSVVPSGKPSTLPASNLTPTPSPKTTSSPKTNNGNSEDNKNNRSN